MQHLSLALREISQLLSNFTFCVCPTGFFYKKTSGKSSLETAAAGSRLPAAAAGSRPPAAAAEGSNPPTAAAGSRLPAAAVGSRLPAAAAGSRTPAAAGFKLLRPGAEAGFGLAAPAAYIIGKYSQLELLKFL